VKKNIIIILLIFSIGLGIAAFFLHLVGEQRSRVELPILLEDGLLKFNTPGECMDLNLRLTFSEASRDCVIDSSHFFTTESVGTFKTNEHVIVDVIDQDGGVLLLLFLPDVNSTLAVEPFAYQLPPSCSNAMLRSSKLSCIVKGAAYQRYIKKAAKK